MNRIDNTVLKELNDSRRNSEQDMHEQERITELIAAVTSHRSIDELPGEPGDREYHTEKAIRNGNLKADAKLTLRKIREKRRRIHTQQGLPP